MVHGRPADGEPHLRPGGQGGRLPQRPAQPARAARRVHPPARPDQRRRAGARPERRDQRPAALPARVPRRPGVRAVTGYYSVLYGSSGVERSTDEVLNGNDDRLFARRLSDLITGRDPSGGNVVLTIDPAVQQAAYDELTSRDYAGAVVALRPQTGEILAMASTPSYDPNPLASHSSEDQTSAWARFNDAEPPVLTNRAISETYPPGSTFKLVDTAAALQNGFTPDSQLTAAPRSRCRTPRRRWRTSTARPAARVRRPRCATRWPAPATPPSPSSAPSWVRTRSAQQAEAFGIGAATAARSRWRWRRPRSATSRTPPSAAAVRDRPARRPAHPAAERDDRRGDRQRRPG